MYSSGTLSAVFASFELIPVWGIGAERTHIWRDWDMMRTHLFRPWHKLSFKFIPSTRITSINRLKNRLVPRLKNWEDVDIESPMIVLALS